MSLFPGGTEIVFAVGAGEDLVGVSHACDHPPKAVGLPKATGARFDRGTLGSRELYERKIERVREFGSLYRLSESELWRLRPEVLILPGPGDLPAVSLENARAVAEGLTPRPSLLLLSPRQLDDVLDDHVRVGFETGRMAEARSLRERMWARIEAVETRAARARSRTVAFVGWPDPAFAGGYWIPQLIEIAGGTDVLASPGFAAPGFRGDDLLARDPDTIVFACDDLPLARMLREMERFTTRQGWERLRAVRGNRVYVGEGACFARPGPRVIDGLEALAWAIHPQLFPEPPRDVLRRLGD